MSGGTWKKASKATAYVEASIALSLIVGAVLQKGLFKGRKKKNFVWTVDSVELKYA